MKKYLFLILSFFAHLNTIQSQAKCADLCPDLQYCKVEIEKFLLDNYKSGCKKWETACDVKAPIYRTGKVGIGANNVPSGYSLGVKGNVIAEKVRVRLKTNWPDYVFEPSYTLKTLKEVEQFIRLQEHLPDFPSEKEIVAQDGIELNDITIKQQAKIEEVFLHLIEMQAKAEKLKEKIELLEKENEQLRLSEKH